MNNTNPWFTFIALLFLLIGLYAALHTISNLMLPKYPMSGVLAINTSGYTPANQKDSDCTYDNLYYSDDGITLREPYESEKQQTQMETSRCIKGIQEVRDEVRNQDIGVAALFLFLGGGLLLSKRLVRI